MKIRSNNSFYIFIECAETTVFEVFHVFSIYCALQPIPFRLISITSIEHEVAYYVARRLYSYFYYPPVYLSRHRDSHSYVDDERSDQGWPSVIWYLYRKQYESTPPIIITYNNKFSFLNQIQIYPAQFFNILLVSSF